MADELRFRCSNYDTTAHPDVVVVRHGPSLPVVVSDKGLPLAYEDGGSLSDQDGELASRAMKAFCPVCEKPVYRRLTAAENEADWEEDSARRETISYAVKARMDWEIHFRRGLVQEIEATAVAAAYVGRSSLWLAEFILAKISEFDEMFQAVLIEGQAAPRHLYDMIALDHRSRDYDNVGMLSKEREIAPPETVDPTAGVFPTFCFQPLPQAYPGPVHALAQLTRHTDPSPVLNGKFAGATTFCELEIPGHLVSSGHVSLVDCPACAPALRRQWDEWSAARRTGSP